MSNSRFEYVKSFENKNDLLKNTYIVIRIDGKGFTKFTDAHQYQKPNEIHGIRLMILAGLSVMESFPEIFLAYGQSDDMVKVMNLVSLLRKMPVYIIEDTKKF